MADFWKQHAAEWDKPGAVALCPCGVRFFRMRSFWIEEGQGPDYAHELTPDFESASMRGVLVDWMTRVWCKEGRSLTIGHSEHVSFVHLARRDGWLMTHRHVHEAIHWMLTSPDSPVAVSL